MFFRFKPDLNDCYVWSSYLKHWDSQVLSPSLLNSSYFYSSKQNRTMYKKMKTLSVYNMPGISKCHLSCLWKLQKVEFSRQLIIRRYNLIRLAPFITPCNRIHRGIEFRIPSSGFRIPSLWIPNSNLLDYGFQSSAFQITTTWIPNSNIIVSTHFCGSLASYLSPLL